MIFLLLISICCLMFKHKSFLKREEYKRYIEHRKKYNSVCEKFIQRYKFLADHQEDVSLRLLKYELIADVKSSSERRPEEDFLRSLSSFPEQYSFSFLKESYSRPKYIFDEDIILFCNKFLEDTQYMYGKIIKKETFRF